MRHRTFFLLPLLVLCLAAVPATQPTIQPTSQPATRPARQPALPPGATVVRDLKYGNAPGQANLLDLYLPAPEGHPQPLVVWIHGGGWQRGDKVPCMAVRLVGEGFVVASINYRFSQEAPFPAQIHDCKGAIRWLRAHAQQYGIDPNRIGVWGASAGGHLAALVGTSGGEAALEGAVGGNLDQSSRVQAVCDWFGPTDMNKIQEQSGPENEFKLHPESSPWVALFGGPDKATPELVAQANPITFVTKDDPPFLVMHGDRDNVVPLAQGQMLADALKAVGVPCDFRIVPGAGHGNGFKKARETVRDFFQRYLKQGVSESASRPRPVVQPAEGD